MPLFERFYKEYRCSRNAPLSCEQPQNTVEQLPGAKFCLECGFPATLPDKAEIRGSRGTYQVISLLASRGMGRLYSGILLNDSQPVVIKEYLLPTRCFNPEETRQRKETFKRVAGVSPADGRTQDFRLISPKDAIADQQGERCYLVTNGDLEAKSQTLSRYLMAKGAMKPPQVREVLNQALQTLQFLHTQKLRLPSGQVRQGLAHGNITLDSLLILENNQQFYIYLCDLAIWERLFDSPSAQPSSPEPEQDLVALGLVAFYLWVGRETNDTSGQSLDPRDNQQWPHSDDPLKRFLYRLIGLDTPFDSAEAARQALLQLPKEDQSNALAPSVVPEQEKKGFRKLLLILGVLALLLLGGGIWYFLSPRSGVQQEDMAALNKFVARFADVNGIPSGNFTYTGESDGTWSSVLEIKPESEQNLEELLKKPKPDVDAQFIYQPLSSPDVRTASAPIDAVRTGKANFAISSLVDKVTDDLDSKPVAYDGLLVFVAFSKKEKNLPKALQGKISLDQLRDLYTGKIKNWQQFGPNLPDLPVKLYAPTEPEARHQFEHLVLKDDRQQIAFFESPERVTQLSTAQTQRQIVSEFDEGRAGIISFGILSKTWDQCAGYPLALGDDNTASQAIFRFNGQPINPSDNLCDKNNRLDVQTFATRSYPLGYPLFVVYPKDNSRPPAGPKFAELLTTSQGQCLLHKAGLVPLQPVPENQPKSNGC